MLLCYRVFYVLAGDECMFYVVLCIDFEEGKEGKRLFTFDTPIRQNSPQLSFIISWVISCANKDFESLADWKSLLTMRVIQCDKGRLRSGPNVGFLSAPNNIGPIYQRSYGVSESLAILV